MRSFVKTSLVAVALAAGFAAPVAFTTPVAAQAAQQDSQLSPLAAELVAAAGDQSQLRAIIARENNAGNGASLATALADAIRGHTGVDQTETGNLGLVATEVAVASDNQTLMAAVAQNLGGVSPAIAAAIVTEVATKGSAAVATAYVNNVSYNPPPTRTVTPPTTQTVVPTEPTTTDTPVVLTPVVPTTPTIPTVVVPPQSQVVVNAQQGNPVIPQVGGGTPSSPN